LRADGVGEEGAGAGGGLALLWDARAGKKAGRRGALLPHCRGEVAGLGECVSEGRWMVGVPS